MNYEDFIKKPEPPPVEETTEKEEAEAVQEEVVSAEEELEQVEINLDVQKAVVESLAAEKVEQDEKIAALEKEKTELVTSLENLKKTMEEMRTALENVGELLARNTEKPVSNQVSVLDRNPELDDRFDGETRDHILEILKEARDAAEASGRIRRAQLLESVLAVNESTGELAKRRAALEKLFADNMNIINGQVINELDKLDIRYKDGETYLLAKEIIRRSY